MKLKKTKPRAGLSYWVGRGGVISDESERDELILGVRVRPIHGPDGVLRYVKLVQTEESDSARVVGNFVVVASRSAQRRKKYLRKNAYGDMLVAKPETSQNLDVVTLVLPSRRPPKPPPRPPRFKFRIR